MELLKLQEVNEGEYILYLFDNLRLIVYTAISRVFQIYIYIIYQNKTQKMQTKCFMVITNLQCARMNKLQIHNIANYSFIKLFSLKVLIS